MKAWIRSSLVLIVLLAFAQIAIAADFTSSRAIEDPKKPWTITFNQEVDIASISNKTIYITDSSNKKIATTYNALGNKVTIIPEQSYISNATYHLHVEKGVYSSKGKSLSTTTKTPFVYTQSNSYITNVEMNYSSIVTNIIVKAHTEVFHVTVTVNGQTTDMNYQQGNKYTLGVTGLSEGNEVTIKAYDADDQLLDTKTVKVK